MSLKMLLLFAVMITSTLALPPPVDKCFTATTTVKPLSYGDHPPCEEAIECPTPSTTTLTPPAFNAACAPTPTVTHTLPCYPCYGGGGCPTRTITVTESHSQVAKTDSAAFTSWSIITMVPTATLGVDKAAEHCHITKLHGAQAVITKTVCEHVPKATVCSVCIGCGAPVTVCN